MKTNNMHLRSSSFFQLLTGCKKIMILTILVTGFSCTALAHPVDHLKNEIMKSFNKEFYDAQHVQWEEQKDFVKISFISQNKTMFAYYTKTGEQIAVTKNLLSAELPFELSASLKNKYKGYVLADLFEITANGELHYYATLANASKQVILHTDGRGNWQLYSKEKK